MKDISLYRSSRWGLIPECWKGEGVWKTGGAQRSNITASSSAYKGQGKKGIGKGGKRMYGRLRLFGMSRREGGVEFLSLFCGDMVWYIYLSVDRSISLLTPPTY